MWELQMIEFIAIFCKFEELKIPLAKMVDLVPLGARSGGSVSYQGYTHGASM